VTKGVRDETPTTKAGVDEAWISVDVETSGPTPGTGSLIALGACLVDQPEVQFESTIAPIPGLPWSKAAERVHRLSRERLAVEGTSPENAMRSFVDWVDVVAAGRRAVFVGFNATFDWMFVADYAWRFARRNPFGISGLDIKALYLGRHLDEVRRWSETTSDHILRRYKVGLPHTHRPLDDALEQAELCRRILAEVPRGPR
jgi:DNA polymerase III epsilon subunit-like protein